MGGAIRVELNYAIWLCGFYASRVGVFARDRTQPIDSVSSKQSGGTMKKKGPPSTGVSRERATTKAFLFNGIERDDAHAVKWFQFGC